MAETCCGHPMVPAQRFEPAQTVDVLLCLEGCGRELPPFGSCCRPVQMRVRSRQGHMIRCERCNQPVYVQPSHTGIRRYCSRVCERTDRFERKMERFRLRGANGSCHWCSAALSKHQVEHGQMYCSKAHASRARERRSRVSFQVRRGAA